MDRAQAQQVKLSDAMSADFNKRFETQSDLIAGITRALAPTLAGGASAHGFSAEELAAKNTAAINEAGAANANAQRNIAGQLAGRGGDSGLQSGVDAQLRAGVTSQQATNLANNELSITNADFATGRDQYNRAVAAEVSGNNSLLQLTDPTALGNETTEANKDAFLEADTINKAQNQEMADIGGLVGGMFGPGLFGKGS